MKKILGTAIVLILIAGTWFYFAQKPTLEPIIDNLEAVVETTTDGEDGSVTDESKTVIGTSVEGRNIVAYHYGTGSTELLFIGGIHGGYSWNTALVAYAAMDYFDANINLLPENIKVTVIPVLNPDGLYKITGKEGRFVKTDIPTVYEKTIPGRFNANRVDLNRNFDCEWQESGTWQSTTVSGGKNAFSEPESAAVQSYVNSHTPTAVVAWYSAAGGIFSSSCRNGVMTETNNITNAYANASGYSPHKDFDFYEITGDMVNWFAKNKIPAISVLLTTHDDIEWEKNRKGIDALLTHYKK